MMPTFAYREVVNPEILEEFHASFRNGWTLLECQVETQPDLDDNEVTVYEWHMNDENGDYAGVFQAVHTHSTGDVVWDFTPFTVEF